MRRFCAPATLVPAAVTPAVLLGPTMSVTLTTGSCSVAKDANTTGVLVATCQPPTITWDKVRSIDLSCRLCMRRHRILEAVDTTMMMPVCHCLPF